MVSNNARHIRALRVAEEKIFQSKLANYVRELYLYGSMARGEIRWDSDIALLLILESSEHDKRALKREILYLKGSLTEDDINAPEDFASNDYDFLMSAYEQGLVGNAMGAMAQGTCEKYLKRNCSVPIVLTK